ncbi:MAG: hypothetical protein KDB37_11115, partial [Ilumatobacter sp.]|nr:hypothetical protein [Ilumatobacter sp.]
ADATAAIVNVTLIAADGPGHVTLFPCGDRPEASTLNYAAGEVVPNGAIVALSNTGSLCVSTHRSADIVLDVSGFVPAGVPTLATSTPARFLDTRGDGTVDGESNGGGAVPGGHQVEIRVAGRSGVPADATAAILNVTIIAPQAAAGHVTVHPCGELPVASNLNHTQSGVVRANNAVTKLSERGTVCVFTVAEADFVVDVNGWLRG